MADDKDIISNLERELYCEKIFNSGSRKIIQGLERDKNELLDTIKAINNLRIRSAPELVYALCDGILVKYK